MTTAKDEQGPELAQFIRETLVQIHGGVAAAAEALGPGDVNPQVVGGGAGITEYHSAAETYVLGGDFVTVVNFDVAITTVKTKEGGGGFHLKIAVASGGLDATRGSSQSTASRIAFKVPLKLPTTAVRQDRAPERRPPMDKSKLLGKA